MLNTEAARAALADLALDLGARTGVRLPVARLRLFVGVNRGREHEPTTVPPSPDEPSADALGRAYESTLDGGHRHAGGVHYTPAPIADGVVGIALRGRGQPLRNARVLDPAVGGGAFLLAAGRALEHAGLDRRRIVEQQLFGLDIDPLAVAVAEAALALWSGGGVAGDHLAVGDALCETGGPPFGGGFDLVVGNPPFQGQLQRSTARSRDDAARLGRAFGRAATGYADTAALFLVAATKAARPGGRVALVQPESLLAARDARPAREAVLQRASLVGLWCAHEPVFDAAVRVCAPVLAVGAPEGRVAVWHGAGFARVEGDCPPPRAADSWASLAAAASGVPVVAVAAASADASAERRGRLGDWCRATAGFRDQFYGVAAAVREANGFAFPRLVTVGLIDPGVSRWGDRPARIAGRSVLRPSVDLARLDERVRKWVEPLLVPKVLVATQTRVVEAAVDRAGSWVPSVPAIALIPLDGRLDHAAAALLAPPVSAWALARYGGTALTSDALKLAARQVLEVPDPLDGAAWDEGAAMVPAVERAGATGDHGEWVDALRALGAVMCRAYGEAADGAVFQWWLARLPKAGRTRAGTRSHGAT